MHKAAYYGEMAERARRLARAVTNRELEAHLLHTAQDYDHLAEDLENGAIVDTPPRADAAAKAVTISGSALQIGRSLRPLGARQPFLKNSVVFGGDHWRFRHAGWSTA